MKFGLLLSSLVVLAPQPKPANLAPQLNGNFVILLTGVGFIKSCDDQNSFLNLVVEVDLRVNTSIFGDGGSTKIPPSSGFGPEVGDGCS